MPGRLPDPGPGAVERVRRLRTEPLAATGRGPLDHDEVTASAADATAAASHAATSDPLADAPGAVDADGDPRSAAPDGR